MEITSLVKELTNKKSTSCSDLEIISMEIRSIQDGDQILNDGLAQFNKAKIGDKYLQ